MPLRHLDFRRYIDRLLSEEYSVRPDIAGSDPDLIDPGGKAVETWREEYPYEQRMSRDEYEEQKYALQVELLKFQYWTQDPAPGTSCSSKAAMPRA